MMLRTMPPNASAQLLRLVLCLSPLLVLQLQLQLLLYSGSLTTSTDAFVGVVVVGGGVSSRSLVSKQQQPPRLVGQQKQQQQRHAVEPKAIQTERSMDDTAADDDTDDYDYIEYEVLTDTEFIGSEWLVGTNWDSSQNRIEETWVRLAVDQDAKQVAIWGDGSQGVWKLDVASQFLSVSKENVLWGKNIWACTVDDYYYLQGTVRGWKYWTAAAVVGQWQAKRLGCDPEEAGIPLWLDENYGGKTNEDSDDDDDLRKVSWKGGNS